MYRLIPKAYPELLNYRYSNQEKTLRSLTGLANHYCRSGIKTEHDLISDWTNFARDALVGKYRESKTTCWIGHYEQFGRTMLQLYKLCENKDNEQDRLLGLGSIFFESGKCEFLVMPTGTEDRIFYRCWFSLLGHPDFLKQKIDGVEAFTYSHTEFLLYLASKDLQNELRGII